MYILGESIAQLVADWNVRRAFYVQYTVLVSYVMHYVDRQLALTR